MWSSHLFRTFFRKVYRPNCQVFQGVQRFSKITASRPVAVSRTRRATSCATPRFFQFLVYFRKWSNMWSTHLFRTFFRKVYRPNCQCCQGVQRFEQIYQGKPLWVSRIQYTTSSRAYAPSKRIHYTKCDMKSQIICPFIEKYF